MRAPMKVTFVLPSFSGGGAERVMLQVAAGLPPSRFETSLLVLDGTGALRDLVPPSLPWTDLKTSRLRHAVGRLRAEIHRVKPDTVVSTMGYLNLAILAFIRPGMGKACRFVTREANMPEATIRRFPSHLLGALAYRYLYPGAACVICNSQAVSAALQQLGVPSNKIAKIDNPIDVEEIRRAAGPISRDGTGRRFVAVGRLTHQKGFDRLIDWFKELPMDCRLTILGDGPDRAKLERQRDTAGLNDRLFMPGFSQMPWRDVALADAFVMPSRWEGMPNAALEALALGVPVIATTDAGGLAELADDVPNGRLTVVKDSAAFIHAMRETVKLEGGLPPSALPERFLKDHVLADYAAAIEG
jgi:glycosyltransferase involved in cell wall biosynthesis